MSDKKVYENQQLTLKLNTYVDLSPEVGNTAFLISDPTDTVTQVDVLIDGNPTNGVLTYTFPINILKTGDYRVQAYLKLQQIAGITFEFHVYERFF